jgi:RNA polymerase sigma-70 factor (ECF subfamily)
VSTQIKARAVSLEEIETVYRERYRPLLRVALMIVGDLEAAEDAVQEAFARAIRHRFEFRGEAGLESWLWRIVINTAKSHHAKPGRSPATDPAETDDRRPDAEAAALRRLLGQLPERQRLVLFLRYYADLDYRRIAEVLTIAPGTVAATLNAAHAKVRQLIEEASE